MNSLGVIRKEKPEYNILNLRVTAGTRETVHPGLLELDSTPLPGSSEISNEWTARSMPPDEELPLRIIDIANLETSLQEKVARIADLETSLQALMESKDQQIMDLGKEIQIQSRDQQVREKEKAITDAKMIIHTRDEKIRELESKVSDLTNVLSEKD